MDEIRDIKPPGPLWQKRPVRKTDPETEREERQREQGERRGGKQGDDGARGSQIDEYV